MGANATPNPDQHDENNRRMLHIIGQAKSRGRDMDTTALQLRPCKSSGRVHMHWRPMSAWFWNETQPRSRYRWTDISRISFQTAIKFLSPSFCLSCQFASPSFQVLFTTPLGVSCPLNGRVRTPTRFATGARPAAGFVATVCKISCLRRFLLGASASSAQSSTLHRPRMPCCVGATPPATVA